MYKAFKYRLYPKESQKALIVNHIGSCRFVYNLALETKKTACLGSKHSYTAFDLINQLTGFKKDFPWLRDVNSQSLQQEIRHMNNAYKQFFNGGGFPKFKGVTLIMIAISMQR